MTDPPDWPPTGPNDPLFRSAHLPAIHRVRDQALGLPDTAEKIMRGHIPTITVGGKNFAIFWRADARPNVCLNAGATVQDTMVHADPDCYFVPAYMGKRGWIGVRLDVQVDWDTVTRLVEEAHQFAAPPPKKPRRRAAG